MADSEGGPAIDIKQTLKRLEEGVQNVITTATMILGGQGLDIGDLSAAKAQEIAAVLGKAVAYREQIKSLVVIEAALNPDDFIRRANHFFATLDSNNGTFRDVTYHLAKQTNAIKMRAEENRG